MGFGKGDEGMSKHTPGPWTKNKYGELLGPDGRTITVWDAGIAFGQRSSTTEANARLIAAAPSMLEVLKKIRFAMETKGPVGLKNLLEGLDEAEVAIKQAEGE